MTWRERLLTWYGQPDSQQYMAMVKDAGTWATCAVGEQRLVYGDRMNMSQCTCTDCNAYNAPNDSILLDLGNAFFRSVERKDIEVALEILNKIEDRARQLRTRRNRKRGLRTSNTGGQVPCPS